MHSRAVTATRERFDRLAAARLSWELFAEEGLEALREVGYDAAVIAPIDSSTGMVTGSVKRELPDDSYPWFARYEYLVAETPDTFPAIARRENPVSVLEVQTGGDPRRNPRFDEFLAPRLSIAHEVRVAASDAAGLVGGFSLFRTVGARGFDADEAELLRRLVAPIARGLRTGPGRTAGAGPTADRAVLVVDGAGRLEARSADARAWLAELDPTGARPIPVPVVSVVMTARVHGSSEVRVPSPRSGWVRIRGMAVSGAEARDTPTVVVDIEPLRGTDATRLTLDTIGLTRREREVAELVLVGSSTAQIADRLHLSAYTVQDHLKAIFAKAGVRSRRELVASLPG